MTSVKEKANKNIPEEFTLFQNYPNPFNPSTIISYQIASAGKVTLKVYDLLARPFAEIFTTTEVPFDEPLYAPLAPSEPCAICGEMTMATKMMKLSDGRQVCIPCSEKSRK